MLQGGLRHPKARQRASVGVGGVEPTSQSSSSSSASPWSDQTSSAFEAHTKAICFNLYLSALPFLLPSSWTPLKNHLNTHTHTPKPYWETWLTDCCCCCRSWTPESTGAQDATGRWFCGFRHTPDPLSLSKPIGRRGEWIIKHHYPDPRPLSQQELTKCKALNLTLVPGEVMHFSNWPFNVLVDDQRWNTPFGN